MKKLSWIPAVLTALAVLLAGCGSETLQPPEPAVAEQTDPFGAGAQATSDDADTEADDPGELVFGDLTGFGDGMADVIGPPNGTVGYPEEEELAKIWGGNEIVWDGIPIGDQLDVCGVAVYEESGSPWTVEVLFRTPQNGSLASRQVLRIEMAPGRFPPSCFGTTEFVPNCQVWGVDVRAGGHRDEENGFSDYTVAFLSSGEEPIGVRAHVSSQPDTIDDETARRWITAFVQQCLKSGNTFSLKALAKAPGPV